MPSSSPPLADDRAPMDRRMAQLGSTSGTGLPLQPPTPPSTAPPSTGGDELPALLLRRRSSPTTSPVLPAAGTILRRLTGRSPLGRSLCGFGSSASRAAYDISDMLDEFQSTEPDAGKKKGVFHKLATAPSRFPMASKMKRMRKELAKNTEEHKNFSFVPNTASFEQHRADPRPQLPELTDESVIIGRSEDKRNIIAALLTRGSEESTIILPRLCLVQRKV
ncbi:hypothetical protein DAI22_05g102700 [Oryza sativa Japonica Group]|nr:hypothetical protein DAI22_05g102700 [Oryza sativa Japonica Group]